MHVIQIISELQEAHFGLHFVHCKFKLENSSAAQPEQVGIVED